MEGLNKVPVSVQEMGVRIFGAGPAGTRTAELLAKAGHDVTVYEEHDEIGKPVQCTGILTNAVEDVLEIPDRVVDFKINKVRVHSPNARLDITFTKPNLVVDRTKLDNWLAKKAKKAGASIETGVKLLRPGITLKVKTSRGVEYWKHETTIGADGPHSRIAKHINPHLRREYFAGLQATIESDNDGAIEFYPFIKNIAWATPESNDRMRIGVMSRLNIKTSFEKLKKLFPGRILSTQSGTIPYYQPELKRSEKGFYLIGDAAGMVKATTGGGIVQALKAAPLLTEAITKNKNWDALWKRKQGTDLWLHRKIREKLDKFNENDWDELLQDCSPPSIMKILNEVPRDYTKSMMTKLVMRKPALMKYAFK